MKKGEFKDITGQRFGRLIAVRILYEETQIRGHTVWETRCDCGNMHKSQIGCLGKSVKSCGCMSREYSSKRKIHGESSGEKRTQTTEHSTWTAMKDRCSNPNNRNFHRYGGRGIYVCSRWLGANGYINFLSDMGRKPEGLSLDRINNDSGYSKENCRWATRQEQANNRGDTILLTYANKTHPLPVWAEEISMSRDTLYCRIRAGWNTAKAIETPVRRKTA